MLERTFKLFQRGVHQQLVYVRNRRRKVETELTPIWQSEDGPVEGDRREELDSEAER